MVSAHTFMAERNVKPILILIVGLILAGCGSTETHVRNRHGAVSLGRDAESYAVDTICVCP